MRAIARANASHLLVSMSSCLRPLRSTGRTWRGGCSPRCRCEGDPAALDQAVQRRVERALLDQEHVVRAVLDRFRDGMPVRWSEPERAKDQEIEGALEQLDAVAARLVDILGESTPTHLECQGVDVGLCLARVVARSRNAP